MSRTVDERIVSMQFDNENFEQNVRTSMSTLEKLKQSLNLKGAAKGIDDLNAATKRVDMSGIARGVEQCSLKFNALYTISDQVLRNIVNKAQAAGEKLIKSLSVDNVSAGWDKYAQKTANVQTLVNSTGKSVAEINEYLNKLMWYSDETSYGFTDMTNALATMTSSGGNIDKLIPMIMGVANATAYAGKSSAEFSRLMQYSVNQAYSTGYMQVQDWKSIEGATVNSKQLIQSLISAGEELGKIEKGTINLSNFRGSLADKWLDKDVMEAGFGAFSQVTEEIYKGIESGIFENYADGLEKIGNKYGEVAARAAASAQEAKTFGEAMDATKDAAASSWMRIFEIIFGNYEEARVLWTKLANTLYDVFVAPVQNFADLIEEAFSSSPIGKIVGRIKELTGSIDKVSAKVKNVIKTAEDYEKIVDRIINNEFGNGQKRWDKLTEMGYDWAHAQNLVNERLGCSVRHATNYSEAQSEVAKSQEKVNEEQSKTIDNLAKLSDKELKQIGFTQNEIKELRELAKVADDAGYSLSQVVDNPDLLSGRNLFIGSFENIGNAILQFAGTIKKAFTDVFGTLKPTQLYKFIAAFHGLTTKMQLSKKTTDKLVRTFKGLFAVLKIVTTITGGTLKIAFKILTTVLGAFNLDILDATAYVGDLLVKFQQWLTENNFVIKGIQKLADALASGVKKIKAWFESFKESETVVAIVGALKTKLSELKDIGTWAIAGLKNGFQNGIKAIPEILTDLGKKIIDAIKKVLGIHSPSTVFFELAKNCIQGFVNGIKAFFGIVTNSMSEFGSVIVDGFKAIPWDKLIPVGISVGLIITATKIAAALNTFAKTVSNVSNTVNDITNIFNSLTKSLKAKLKADVFKSIAASIAMIAGAIFLLAQINDQGKLWSAVGAVGVITLILVGLSYAMNKMDNIDGFDFAKLSAILFSFSAAVFIMAYAVKIVGELSWKDASQGLGGLIVIIGAISAIFLAFGKFVKNGYSARSMDKAGVMIAKMSVALLLMVAVAKLSAGLGAESLKGLGIATAAIGMMIAVCWAFGKFVNGYTAQNIDKVGAMILKMSFALLLMVGVCKLAGSLSIDDMKKGGLFVGAFIVFVSALLFITELDKNKQIAKVSGLLIAVSSALLIMVGTCAIIGLLSLSTIAKGILFVTAFGTLLIALVSITKITKEEQMGKVAASILAMSLAIGVMAAVSLMLSLVDLESLSKGVAAVSVLGLVMAAMVNATKGCQDVKGNLITLIVAITLMVAAVVGLTFIDEKELISATASLTAIITAFSLLIAVTKLTKNSSSMRKTLFAMLGVVGGLAAIVAALSLVDASKNIKNAQALSILLTAFSSSLLILGNTGRISKTASKYMWPMLGIVAGLAVILGVMSALKVEGSIPTAISLGVLLNAMASAMLILSFVKGVNPTSIGTMALMGLVVAELAVILGIMSALKVEASISTAVALSTLLLAMSKACLMMAFIPVSIAAKGALGLVAFVAIIAALLAALGGLSKIPGFNELIKDGGETLALIGYAIGNFVGSICGGIAAGVSTALPAIANNLSQFMENVQPFIDGLNSIDKSILISALVLAGTILAITASSVLSSVMSFVGGGSSIVSFAAQLPILGLGLRLFSKSVEGINADNIKAATSAAKGLAEMADSIPRVGGLASLFAGDNSIALFSIQLPILGAGLLAFSKSVEGINFESIKAATSAAKGMAEMADCIPNQGGLVAWFVGDNSVASFAIQLPILGAGLLAFSRSVEGVSAENINAAVGAAKGLAEMASSIPRMGGLVSFFAGDNSIATFSIQLPLLGAGLLAFSTSIEGINADNIKAATSAAKGLAEMADSIPRMGGLLSFLTGDNSIATFSIQLPLLGVGLLGFSKSVEGINQEAVASATSAAKNLVLMCEHIPNQGGLLAWVTGDNSVASFAIQLPLLGVGLLAFSKSVEGINADAVMAASEAAKNLALMCEHIPNQGGMVAWFTGDNSMVMFSAQLPILGVSLLLFSNAVKGIDGESVKAASEAAVNLAKMTSIIPNEGGMKAWFSGESGFVKFATNLPTLGANIKLFSDKIKGLEIDSVKVAADAAKKLAEMVDTLPKKTDKITKFGDNLVKFGPNLKTFLNSIGTMSADTISNASKAITAINGIWDKIDTKKSKNAGKSLISEFISGMDSKKSDVKTKGETVAKNGANGAKSKDNKSAFKSAGKDLGKGLIEGIESKEQAAYDAGYALGQKAVQGEKDGQQSKSPSKLTIKAGKWLGEGLVIGIQNMGRAVYKASYGMGETAVNTISGAVARVSDFINSDIDSQPTIRPVLDLSDIKSGVNTISGLFSGETLAYNTSIAGSIASSMSSKIQNGGNNDVISAIEDLGRKLSKSSGNTYSINGITYDDGSNVSNAVRDLIRAVAIERRV